MSSLLHPTTGAPLVDLAKAMAADNAMATWVAGNHPLAGRVGWFNLGNISSGLLGAPVGFLVMYVVSLFTKPPSSEMMAFIDEIRKPRGKTVLEEKAA
jgi:cation/acetate symporter